MDSQKTNGVTEQKDNGPSYDVGSSQQVFKITNFIGGQWKEPASKKWVESFEPSTGNVFCYVPDSSNEDVNEAVLAAKKAFPQWSSLPAGARSDILNKIADKIEQNLEAFAVAESRDQGKTITQARTIEIPRAIKNFRFFATAINHHEEMSCTTDKDALNYSLRTPIGVAGLITPWNLPLYLLTWKIAPAIAVGNTVVCKPSEFTSLTAWMLTRVIAEVGLPSGVVNFVFGTGPIAGNAMVTHPNIPLISFTGGTVTGEKIIIASAPMFKRLSLELGGKNPNIIFDDADLSECLPTSVRSSFTNQGEICLCGSRIFVQEGIYTKFVKEFVEMARKWKIGDPSDPASNMGAVISQEHLAKINSYIDIARTDGGTIEMGGDVPAALNEKFKKGYWLNPTVITNLPMSSRVLSEEIFGPVVTITPFKTEDEVVEYANSVRYGLASSLWSSDIKRAHRVAAKIEAGTVWVNCWMLRDLRVPFGGMKASGIGREGGDNSIDTYTERKTVVVKLT